MKNKFISSTLLASAIALTGTISTWGITYTSNHHYYQTDYSYGGQVLKIGYTGPCSATVAKDETWTENVNVLVACCPGDGVHTELKIYGTAVTNGNVYVSGLTRVGDCFIDGGTWTCNGQFRLGCALEGTVTINNGGKLRVEDTFRINFGSTLTIKDTSKLQLTLDSSGTLGENGGIYIFNSVSDTISLETASNLSIDATTYSANAENFVINDIIVADSKNSTLDNLTISVGGNTFVANDESALNQYLSKIEIIGYENYVKSFVVTDNKSVALHLSKIPEPSAFGLLAGLGALALVASRRRRQL